MRHAPEETPGHATVPPARDDPPALKWAGQAGEEPAAIYASQPKQVAKAALNALREARRHEGNMTTQLMAAIESTPAALAGLEYRIKAPSSLARKIRTIAVKKMLTPDQAAERLDDTIRYTVTTARVVDLMPTLTAVVDFLITNGWSVRSFEQSFVKRNPYKGIHLILCGASGHRCEIQFHTESALEVKEPGHTDYETYRDIDLPLEVRTLAYERSVSAWDQVPTPPGLRKLTTLGGVAVVTRNYPPPT